MRATLVCITILGFLAGCARESTPADILIENVTVYSGSDSTASTASVAIRDGKFLAIIQPGEGSYNASETIDASGLYMMPGLWDAHTHIRSSKERGLDLEEFLKFGVTSILDLGGYLERLKTVERDVANGSVPGPHIYSSYFMLNGESFADYQHVVTTVAQIENAINELASAGAFQIKVHRALSPDLLPAVVKIAHERGIRVTGHIPLGVHPLDACEIGMDGIEHMGSFVEALVSVAPEGDTKTQQAIDFLLSKDADSLYECLAERDVAVTPTLIIYPGIAARRSEGKEIPQAFIDLIESMNQITYRMYEANVRLLAGTDATDLNEGTSTLPGTSLLDEMLILEEAGIPPIDVIGIASLNAARSIGVDGNTGSIEPGKDADFLLLSADPGRSVQNIRSIVSVYKAGRSVYADGSAAISSSIFLRVASSGNSP